MSPTMRAMVNTTAVAPVCSRIARDRETEVAAREEPDRLLDRRRLRELGVDWS